MNRKNIFVAVIVAISLFIVCLAVASNSVNILPLRGPIGTTQISPANGSATAYRMDFSGQKSICFQSNTTVDVYIGSHTAIDNATGWGLYNQGDSLCIDLKGGTTIYIYGDGSGSDVRVIIAK